MPPRPFLICPLVRPGFPGWRVPVAALSLAVFSLSFDIAALLIRALLPSKSS